tara:strand:+ start:51284 stop:51571 length:288 start_codon:yes stop_codon:yes gene_type:complete
VQKAGPISDERICSHATDTGDFQVDKAENSVIRFLLVQAVHCDEKRAMRATHSWKVSVAARRSQVNFFQWFPMNCLKETEQGKEMTTCAGFGSLN